jgi:hypothetical protein
MTTIVITEISRYLDLSDVYEAVGDLYDTDAIMADYIAAINAAARQIVPGLAVLNNGEVIIDTENDIETAREIDWHGLIYSIDITPFLEAHDLQRQ